jgi:hypothetical protein
MLFYPRKILLHSSKVPSKKKYSSKVPSKKKCLLHCRYTIPIATIFLQRCTDGNYFAVILTKLFDPNYNSPALVIR